MAVKYGHFNNAILDISERLVYAGLLTSWISFVLGCELFAIFVVCFPECSVYLSTLKKTVF